jgi:hypothetical protein
MNDRILVGTRKGLFVLARRTQPHPAWQLDSVHFLGEPVTAVLPDGRDGSLHAALNLGHFGVKLRRSRDGGQHWEETAAPAYPPHPEPAPPGPPWKLVQVWCLEAGGAPDELWAGTLPGGLFRSRDRGDSWALVESLWQRPERLEWFGGGYDTPGIHSVCVDPRDGRHVTLAVSCGGVWVSHDGGESWGMGGTGMQAEYLPPERRDDPNVQDVHRVVQCPGRPEVLWVQHHSGRYRSTDAGASWKPLEANGVSRFGYAVAVHPREPDKAWFVPAEKDERRVAPDAKLCVLRSRDGGKSFDVLRHGLPAEPAYDLVYRHGLAIDETGERLAMGSTTGGLWVSENQGDAWQQLPVRLPPVYCVRFG